MKQSRSVEAPLLETQSTLLVSKFLFTKYLLPRVVESAGLTAYLQKLMRDPQLDYKLGYLKPGKWKKTYQQAGLDLTRLNFFPIEEDWARLSVISNATGFSRCYIFVFLMLVDFRILKLPEKGTPWFSVQKFQAGRLICSIELDEREKLLTRVLQT